MPESARVMLGCHLSRAEGPPAAGNSGLRRLSQGSARAEPQKVQEKFAGLERHSEAAGPVGRRVGEKAGGLGGRDGGLDRRGKSGRWGEGKPPARALAVCGAVRGDELDVNNSRQHL